MEMNNQINDVASDIIKESEESEDVVKDEKVDNSSDENSSSVRIVDISHDTTRDSEDNGETFGDCLESAAEGQDEGCAVCGNELGPGTCPRLLTCLHAACSTCTLLNSVTITCPRCKQTSDTCHSVPVDTDPAPSVGGHVPPVRECLVEMARGQLEHQLPAEVATLDSLLTDLQEERDNTRSLVQETYQSYRAILEQCMNYALSELEARHHRKELAIMERMEQLELARRQLQLGLSWADRGQDQLGGLVTQRLEEVMARLGGAEAGDTRDLGLGLGWSSDKEQFCRALRDNFGHFTDTGHRRLVAGQQDQNKSPKLLVSDHGANNKESLVSALLSPEPPSLSPGLGAHLAPGPGLLSLGPLSPLSPVSPCLSSPGPRHSADPALRHPGPVGSALTSPAHSLHGRHAHLSQPDLSSGLPSPRHLTGHKPGPSNLEYSLSQLQPGLATSRPGFTLADLISNVTETEHGGAAWPHDNTGEHVARGPGTPGHAPGSVNALTNLTALAKLDTWHGEQPGLLLPDSLSSCDAVSPGPGPHHSLSPVLGLSVSSITNAASVRGTSPMSPIDSLMPGLGGLNLSPTNLVRSPSNTAGSSLSQRSLNSMQIRCKFGQLGPGKGQFNSPHGFCLGVEEEIIVADTNNHRIQVFEKNGTYRYQFGVAGKEEGQLWYPRKVAVMKTSGKFVVCDRGNERSRMQIFTKHGHFVRKIAIRYIDIVAGLAITREGNIVAVDSVTPTIFVIMEHGELLRWFDCADYMREPSDIAVSGREFYVCDFKGHNVVVFTEEGQFVRRIGCENITNFPNGIDISDAGDILIGDSHGNKFHVVVFANDGSLLGEFECPHVKVSRCCGLKITSEGYVVTLAKNNHHVLVLNTLYIA